MSVALKAALVIAGIGVLAVASFFLLRPSSTVEVPIVYAVGVPDSNVLGLYAGDCLREWHIEVEESEESITITVAVDRHDGVCPDILGRHAVMLAEPWGEREVIDGSQNSAVTVIGPGPHPYDTWLCELFGHCSPSR